MLTPEYLDGVAEPLQAIYAELQSTIQQDIARRIAGADYAITDTAKWQIYKLQEMGASLQEIQTGIAGTLKLSQTEIRALFKTAGVKSMKTDIATQRAAIQAGHLPADTVPLTASAAFTQVMNANAKRTLNTLKKLTGTMARDATGKLNQYLDEAQLMVQSGAFTERQAIDVAVRRFAADGVSIFEYATGVRIGVEAGVRRAVVTGVNQAAAEISLSNAGELDTDLVEVTSHADSRPEHAVWQGGIYSLSGKHPKYPKLSEATGYGTAAGLCGANCRHSFYAYIEGVSEQVPKEAYDPSTYWAEQEQRHNERQIRMWKTRADTLRAGGTDNSRETARVAYWQARQREHVQANGLARLPDREKFYNKGGAVKISTSGVAAQANKMYDVGSASENLKAYIRDLSVRQKIQSGATVKTIDMNAQDTHILGTRHYADRVDKLIRAGQFGPSRLELSVEDAQRLVDRYHGTGIIRRRNDGTWKNEEIITTHAGIVGTVVDNRTGKEAATTTFKIKYGRKGPHVIPDYPSKKGMKSK